MIKSSETVFLMDKNCFDLETGERVWFGNPPRLRPQLPAEPTVQEDIRFSELENSVGRKNAHGNTSRGKKKKKSAFYTMYSMGQDLGQKIDCV